MVSKKVLFSVFLMSSVVVFPGKGRKAEPSSPVSPKRQQDPKFLEAQIILSDDDGARTAALQNLRTKEKGGSKAEKAHATAVLAQIALIQAAQQSRR